MDILHFLNLFNNWPSILIISLVSFYLYSTRNYNYWKCRGVNGPKPLPLIGNVGQLFAKPRCVQMVEDYKKFGKIYGIYEGSTPVLVIAEPELIRDICVKDFHIFVDRGLPHFGVPLLDRSLVNARGEQWKQIRVTVSPTFSSTKMRKMHQLIEDCVRRLDTAMIKIASSENNEVALKQLITNYTTAVIALVAFATKIDTHNTGAEVHPFVKNSQAFFKPSLRAGLFFLVTAVAPSLVKKCNLSFVSSDITNYFQSTIKTIISEREAQKDGKYVDFLQLLIDAKNKSDNEVIDEDINREIEKISESMKKKGYRLEDMDIVAASTIFMLAGSDTTSGAISHLLHELTLNPEYQQRLYEEIKSCENVDYDTISQLPYLDACVYETLRKYPGAVFHQRQASEDYELRNTGLKVEKETAIRISTYALHHDPQYFPNPDQFNPDRFMPENKSQMIAYSFIPFGAGPRNCIGMRFALMNIKTAVVHILCKYRFSQTPKTKTEFVYKKFVVFPQPIDMGTVRLQLRNQ